VSINVVFYLSKNESCPSMLFSIYLYLSKNESRPSMLFSEIFLKNQKKLKDSSKTDLRNKLYDDQHWLELGLSYYRCLHEQLICVDSLSYKRFF
jgi:hypothetical protein